MTEHLREKHFVAYRSRSAADEQARVASVGPRRVSARKPGAPPRKPHGRVLRFPYELRAAMHEAGEKAARATQAESPVPPKRPLLDLRRLFEIEAGLMRERMRILQGSSALAPEPKDKRFQHAVWRNNGYYRRVLQHWLAWKRAVEEVVECADVSDLTRKRLRFVAMQVVEAASPINFPTGNPGFIDRAIKTRGRSLLNGARNLLDDLLHNGGMPSMVDTSKFQVGRNLACTPGVVVYRDDVFELLQYAPSTPTVREIPVVIVPPQINKYYIVDLAPKRSFIEYAVSQGLQVFCMSWRNPTRAQGHWNMDTYALAARRAIEVARDITGASAVNLAGGCAGGTLAAALAAEMAAKGDGDQVNSLTLLVTVLDAGSDMPITLFATDEAIEAARWWVHQRGVLDGHQTRRAFSWLRPGDLVWTFVANNYLMGNPPPAFDVLYWNNDSTRLPAAFHRDLLDVFQGNPLIKPGALKLLDTPVDLRQVRCKSFVAAGITDHITPWTACYLTTRMLGGDVRFVLSSSGHIQSLVNPVGNAKAKYFTHDDYALTPGQWLESAREQQGSWWENWAEWTRDLSGTERPAPATLGNEHYRPIDAAPGLYVHRH